MPNTYYIDGYNVLHHSEVLRPVLRHDFERAREMLVDKLAAFCVATGKQVTIVFDGRDHSQHCGRETHGVQGLRIVYAPPELTADGLIERWIFKANDRLDCVVVTGDRGIRNLCRGLGALTMDSNHFLNLVREHQDGVRETVASLKKGAGARVEDHLSDNERSHLEALRQRLLNER